MSTWPFFRREMYAAENRGLCPNIAKLPLPTWRQRKVCESSVPKDTPMTCGRAQAAMSSRARKLLQV